MNAYGVPVSLGALLTRVLCLSIALGAADSRAQPSNYYGRFEGRLVLVPLDGSRMRLLEPYTFIDSSGGRWSAPAGTVSDGASIPQVAKSFVGGAWDGPYRHAAVIHDVACVQKSRPWELVHLTFYHGMLASGVTPGLAKKMYMAVYHFGPRWEPLGATKHAPKGGWSAAAGTTSPMGSSGCNEVCILGGCVCMPGLPTANRRIDEPHPKASEVPRTEADDYSAFLRLSSEIDRREASGNGMTVEEINKLR